jgi:hypothetical protein
VAVTTANIRDLLNRPPHLVEGTISEYITLRSNEADKIARTSEYDISADNQVTTAMKEDYIKAAVCGDCLAVLIDTIPVNITGNEQTRSDTRYREQLRTFLERASELKKLIAEPDGAAFVVKNTTTRQA